MNLRKQAMHQDKMIKDCDLLLIELNRFSPNMIDFATAIIDDRLEVFEKKIGMNLPIDFKYILKKFNGLSLMGTEVFGLDARFQENSLDRIYIFEHAISTNIMPAAFLPFSPDGRGNHYCLNLHKDFEGLSPVVFWQHDFIYANVEEVEECNASFTAWINEVMIEWTLDDYNYDGTPK